MAARWRYGIPMVLSYVGRDVPGPSIPPGWNHYNRLLIRAADATTYVSDYCRSAIFGSKGEGKGITVGNGARDFPRAALDEIRALRDELRLSPDTVVLFALQRLSIYKGVDILIKSMSCLTDLPCVLLVAGSGADKERLEKTVRDLGLQERVRLLGFVADEDLPSYWGLANIFVFHSYYETFGLVLAEAMRAGKAVVSVRSTAIPEVVRHNMDGLLVEPGNPEEMAGAIRELIDNPERRESLAETGKARAERDFSWDKVAHAYEAVFEEVLQRKRLRAVKSVGTS